MHLGETLEARNQRLFGCTQPVAFVTGSAAPRVGRRIAEHLKQQGFKLVLHAHRPSTPTPNPTSHGVPSTVEALDYSKAHTGNVDASKADDLAEWIATGPVEDEANAIRWCTEIVERLGQVHLLVNSAAIWEPKPLESTTADDFRRYFEVNALGTALTCKHFGLQMTKQPAGGSIINISDSAVRRPYPEFAAYFPSKGAVESLTSSMAVELATRNPQVRVNAVLPGPVLLADTIDEARRQRLIEASLLRREGTADDVAEAVVFLATSPFITGVCLPVDGGRTIYAGPSADPIAHPQVE
jgi:pteridine reductase